MVNFSFGVKRRVGGFFFKRGLRMMGGPLELVDKGTGDLEVESVEWDNKNKAIRREVAGDEQIYFAESGEPFYNFYGVQTTLGYEGYSTLTDVVTPQIINRLRLKEQSGQLYLKKKDFESVHEDVEQPLPSHWPKYSEVSDGEGGYRTDGHGNLVDEDGDPIVDAEEVIVPEEAAGIKLEWIDKFSPYAENTPDRNKQIEDNAVTSQHMPGRFEGLWGNVQLIVGIIIGMFITIVGMKVAPSGGGSSIGMVLPFFLGLKKAFGGGSEADAETEDGAE